MYRIWPGPNSVSRKSTQEKFGNLAWSGRSKSTYKKFGQHNSKNNVISAQWLVGVATLLSRYEQIRPETGPCKRIPLIIGTNRPDLNYCSFLCVDTAPLRLMEDTSGHTCSQ